MSSLISTLTENAIVAGKVQVNHDNEITLPLRILDSIKSIFFIALFYFKYCVPVQNVKEVLLYRFSSVQLLLIDKLKNP
jgi:hypothetical protein